MISPWSKWKGMQVFLMSNLKYRGAQRVAGSVKGFGYLSCFMDARSYMSCFMDVQSKTVATINFLIIFLHLRVSKRKKKRSWNLHNWKRHSRLHKVSSRQMWWQLPPLLIDSNESLHIVLGNAIKHSCLGVSYCVHWQLFHIAAECVSFTL